LLPHALLPCLALQVVMPMRRCLLGSRTAGVLRTGLRDLLLRAVGLLALHQGPHKPYALLAACYGFLFATDFVAQTSSGVQQHSCIGNTTMQKKDPSLNGAIPCLVGAVMFGLIGGLVFPSC
jgi:hypothetical protein